MLIEIKSDVFRKKSIQFHKGLNVVLGDEQASNSIGKSNLLLIIDFVFGGTTYIEHSDDVIKNIGHHSFFFTFEFDKKYIFYRSTENSEIVYECDNNYMINKSKSMGITEFTNFLKASYKLDYVDATFRQIVSVFIRVWGKDNYDDKKPLKTYKNDSNEKLAINNLIKLFDKYTELKNLNDKIDKNNDENKTINAMYRNHYASKISNKSEYKANLKEIENLNAKIKDIKENILKYIINLEEFINKEAIELKSKKNKLLTLKNKYENHLLRIENNLAYKSSISSEHLKKLKEFFPQSNIEKIDKVESFHNGIKTILSKEIKKQKEDLEGKISEIEIELREIDVKIAQLLKTNNKPDFITDELLEYSAKIKELEENNKLYDEKNTKLSNIRTLKKELEESSKLIIKEIQENINTEIANINKLIDDKNNPPIFKIENNKYYLYKPNDTGTGTSKLNLIMFDLAILKLTRLPFLVHDSILFKDIGNERIEKLISYYNQYKKQIFIAIDEHKKYKNIIEILENKKVIKLNKTNTLYNKIWSDKNEK